MAIFNFFGSGEHKVFDHKPIYYDAKKEERRRMFGAVDGSDKSEGYVPGSTVRGSIHKESDRKQRSPMKTAQTVIKIVTIVLVVLMFWFFLKIFPYFYAK